MAKQTLGTSRFSRDARGNCCEDGSDGMKKKLVVFASTFPRWKKDTIPPFVYELSKRLTGKFDVSVLN